MTEISGKQKLVMLGLRSPQMKEAAATEAFATFQTNIAEDWAGFQEQFEDASLSSWADFETWLTNNGVDSSTATNIRTQFESKYASLSDFKDTVLNTYTSWSDFENDFQAGTFFRSEGTQTDGQAMAGVRIFEEAGVTRDGVQAPRGAIEIIGKEVHFSQSSSLQDTTPDDPINYSNLSVSNTTPTPFERFDVSVDVQNTFGSSIDIPVSVQIDGSVERTKTVVMGGSSTKTVTFEDLYLEELGSYDVTVADLSAVTVTVIPSGLIT